MPGISRDAPSVPLSGSGPARSGRNFDYWSDLVLIVAAIGDLLFFGCAMFVAFDVRLHLNNILALTPLMSPITAYEGHFIFGSLLFLALAVRMGMYSPQQILKLRRIFIATLNTALFWSLLYLFLSLLFSVRPSISRLFVIFSTLIGFSFVLGWRWILNVALKSFGISMKLRQRIVIVGWNLEAEKLARAIMHDSSHPYEIVGCVPSAYNEYRLNPPSFVRRLGDYSEIKEIHKQEAVDIILIGDLNPNTREIIALCEYCQREMIQFKIVPTYFQILISGLHLETISGVPVLGVARLPLDSLVFRICKRLLDIVGALVGLVVSAPLVTLFGFLIYRESPGPIVYRQQRMGRRGKLFEIYKLRSMKLDAEKGGAQWATPDDERCLHIGVFMRKWNIDEVPQFWNVLIGEMSLVGPRPERPELIEDFKDQVRHYNARHNVKPGMTGWAQIQGFRGQTDLNERIRCDLYYAENWTPILDVYIMIMTFLHNKNAY